MPDRERLKEFIGKGDLKGFFECFRLEYEDKIEENDRNDFLIYSGRFSINETEKEQNRIEKERYEIERNKLIASVLEFIGKFQTKDSHSSLSENDPRFHSLRWQLDRSKIQTIFTKAYQNRIADRVDCQHYFLKGPHNQYPDWIVGKLLDKLMAEEGPMPKDSFNYIKYHIHKFPTQYNDLASTKINLKKLLAREFSNKVYSTRQIGKMAWETINGLIPENYYQYEFIPLVFRLELENNLPAIFETLKWFIGTFCQLSVERTNHSTLLIFYIIEQPDRADATDGQCHLISEEDQLLRALQRNFMESCKVLPSPGMIHFRDLRTWLRNSLNVFTDMAEEELESIKKAFTPPLPDRCISDEVSFTIPCSCGFSMRKAKSLIDDYIKTHGHKAA